MTVADQVGGFGFAISDDPDNLSQVLGKSIGSLLSTIAQDISAIGGLVGGSKKGGQSAQVAHATTTDVDKQLAGWKQRSLASTGS